MPSINASFQPETSVGWTNSPLTSRSVLSTIDPLNPIPTSTLLIPPDETLPIVNRIDDSLSQATNLSNLVRSFVSFDSVGPDDQVDYYRFSITESAPVVISLTNLLADVDILIYKDLDNNQILDNRDWSRSSTWGGRKDERFSFESLEVGDYILIIYPYNPSKGDRSQTPSSQYMLSIQKTDLLFNAVNIQDASGDGSDEQVLRQGALRFSYDLVGQSSALQSVQLEALSINGGRSITLGTWTEMSQQNILIDLSQNTTLISGQYHIWSTVIFKDGDRLLSNWESLQIVDWQRVTGTVGSDVFNYPDVLNVSNLNSNPAIKTAIVFGLGGTDTLNLGEIQSSQVASLNRVSLDNYRIDRPIQQAIFGGTSFDVLRFYDGREVYFQGLEQLKFADRTLDLTVQPNDPGYANQWNLRATDVTGAWRFSHTQAAQVLLVSLDTGFSQPNNPTPSGSSNPQDIDPTRLIYDPEIDRDDYNDSGHGQRAISIMSAVSNNAGGIVGINRVSPVYVKDIYGGSMGDGNRTSFQSSIRQALAYARSRKMKVVFQGGIQGEYWLTSGGTQNELEALLAESNDDAFYAIAAGNGGFDLDLTDLSDSERDISGGVARLQGRYGNLASVGAVNLLNSTRTNGILNAVSLERSSYSNYGRNLTLSAPTTVPSVNRYGQESFFAGTSASNPQLAAIASLVWSTNLNLTGSEVRTILTETAMDLGALGRDNFYGAGLVNAEAAVRRAYALNLDRQLAQSWKIFA